MSGITDPSRRSPFGRFVAGPARAAAGHLWGFLRYAPWPLKIMAVVVLVGGPAAVVYRFAKHRVYAARLAGQVAEWRGFEEGVRAGDADRMRAALDRVLALNPDDPTALARRRALDTGEADPADQPMVLVMVRQHLRAGRLADAEREARKRLAVEKADWLSRCVAAAALLQRGDRAGAAAELDQLPAPGDSSARLDPGGLLLAGRLFRALDKDPARLRAFAQAVILPVIRSPGAAPLPAADKAGLLECYAEAFDPPSDRPQPAGLAQGWAAAARLADAAVDEAVEAKDAPVLARLGRLGTALEAALDGLRRGGQVSADEARALAGDLRDRTRRAWDGLLAADPASPEAHRGLALGLLRAADAAGGEGRTALYVQARQTLVKGLTARPDDPELAQLTARLVAAEGRPLDATAFLLDQARKHPDRPVWWALVAEAAVLANRRDVALEACGELRKKDPDNRFAVRAEARLWAEAGEPAKALAAVAGLGDDALARDPACAYAYARALAETRAGDRLGGFIRAVADAGEPAVAAATGRGLTDAAGLPPADLAARLAPLLERFPDLPDLARARAEAAYRAAEGGDPVWEPGRVRAAVRAVEQAQARAPDDLELAVMLGWLRLAGESSPGPAARAVAPLAAAADAPQRTARQLELLGAVALAAGDRPAALRHLERATRSADPPAGAFALLARAYQATGQPGKARDALAAARSRPRTPREQAEYLTAAKLVAP